MEGAPEVRYVKVVNRNEFTLHDHYDGRPYVFPPGEERTIPLDAAAHIFGFTSTATEEECRTHCIKRFGYNTPERMKGGGHETFWDCLQLTPMLMRLVEQRAEEDAPEDEPEDEPIVRRRRYSRGRRGKRVLTPRAEPPAIPIAAVADDEVPPAA